MNDLLDVWRDNKLPILRFGGHVLFIAALIGQITYIICRRAIGLHAQPRVPSLPRRSALAFSVLALVSLVSVAVFAVRWRFLSYKQWSAMQNHELPSSLWEGWSGTVNETADRWRLSDWLVDVDLVREAEAITYHDREGSLYKSQYYVGLLAASVFFGVEGVKRGIHPYAVLSFVLLATLGSLACALSLFFVAILYSPIANYHDQMTRYIILSTPNLYPYYALIVYPISTMALLPGNFSQSDFAFLRNVYLIIPILAAMGPRFIPSTLRVNHNTRREAFRSYAQIYRCLSIFSTFLYIYQVYSSVYLNTPAEPSYIRDIFANTISFPANYKSIRFFSGITANIKLLSKHPAISATSLDVLFTAISLLAWVFLRNQGVEGLLENSMLRFSTSGNDEAIELDDRDAQGSLRPDPTNPAGGAMLPPPRPPQVNGAAPVPQQVGAAATQLAEPGRIVAPNQNAANGPGNAPNAAANAVFNAAANHAANVAANVAANAAINAAAINAAGVNAVANNAAANNAAAANAAVNNAGNNAAGNNAAGNNAAGNNAAGNNAATTNAGNASNPTGNAAGGNATNVAGNAANPVGNPSNAAGNAAAPTAPTGPAPPPAPGRRSARVAGIPNKPNYKDSLKPTYKDDSLNRSVDSDGESDNDSDSDSDTPSVSSHNSIPLVQVLELTYAHTGESMAVALFLTFIGGLGALGGAVLGAETYI